METRSSGRSSRYESAVEDQPSVMEGSKIKSSILGALKSARWKPVLKVAMLAMITAILTLSILGYTSIPAVQIHSQDQTVDALKECNTLGLGEDLRIGLCGGSVWIYRYISEGGRNVPVGQGISISTEQFKRVKKFSPDENEPRFGFK